MVADAEMAPVLLTRGIRQCIDLTYAAAAHQTIWEYAPASRAADDYGALLDQLEAKTQDGGVEATPSLGLPETRSESASRW